MLPLVPTPASGESLRSYVARLEEANHQRPGTLISLAEHGATTNWVQLAYLTGIDLARLRTLGWEGYPRVILGARGSTGWRLRNARWWCPNCFQPDGIWHRSWELACVPVCLVCGGVLATGVSAPTARSQGSRLFVAIGGRVEESPRVRRSRLWLGRLLRLTRLLAVTADGQWPTPLGEEQVGQLNTWGYHPPDAPAALAAMLTFVYQLIGGSKEQAVVAEAFRRLDSLQSPIARTLLPKQPDIPARPRRPERSSLDTQRRKDAVADLDGFPTKLIPALAPSSPSDFLPAFDDWPRAEEASLALAMLANPRRDGKPGWASQAQVDLGLPMARVSSSLTLLEEGHLGADLEARVRALKSLALDLGIDFHSRRRILTGLRRPPRLVVRTTGRPIALGWLWVYLTWGRIVPTGPGWINIDHVMPTLAVKDAHASMSLEQRIRLAEQADQMWAYISAADEDTPTSYTCDARLRNAYGG